MGTTQNKMDLVITRAKNGMTSANEVGATRLIAVRPPRLRHARQADHPRTFVADPSANSEFAGFHSHLREHRKTLHRRASTDAVLYVRQRALELLFQLPDEHIEYLSVECRHLW